MPKLDALYLGRAPCETTTGVTVKGLIGLARLCPHLAKLRIHFQATSLVEAATSVTTPSPFDEPGARWEGCALTDLEVGKTPIPMHTRLAVAPVLLQIFPHILNLKYINQGWKTVWEAINDFRRIRAFVHHTGEAHPPHIDDLK